VCDAVRNEYGARAHFTERASRGLDSGVHDYFTISSDHESDQRSLLRACSRRARRIISTSSGRRTNRNRSVFRSYRACYAAVAGCFAWFSRPEWCAIWWTAQDDVVRCVAHVTSRHVTSCFTCRAVPSRASHVIASYLADLRPVFSPVNPAVLIPPALPPSRSMSIAALRCPAAAAVVLLLHYYDYCYYYYCCYYYLNSSNCRLAYSY